MRKLAALALITLTSPNGVAGDVQLPSDVSVAVSAEPTSNLVPGQPVTFVVAVTNNGPAPLLNFGISSSPLYPEQIDLYGSTTDCAVVVTSVTDGTLDYYYDVTWYPTDSSYTSSNDLPLAVGETRSCHFTFPVGFAPPPTFTIDFHLGNLWNDTNATNDMGSVRLRLAAAVEAAPMFTLPAEGMLTFGLLALAALSLSGAAQKMLRRTRGRHADQP